MDNQNNKDNKKTHFGFEDIPYSEKVSRVRDVFNSVASKYDVMNDLMSVGLHRVWKNEFASKIHPTQHTKLLDVGGGTADIVIEYKKLGGKHCTILDINDKMLEVGRQKTEKLGIISDIEWVVGDAEKLPFADSLYDVYTTAFCIRNVTNIQNALNEAYRVLKHGGHFLCLEFSPDVDPFILPFYDYWCFKVLPKLGSFVAKDSSSYQYLAESIKRFPTNNEFTNMMKSAGFDKIHTTKLNFGIVCIHSAWKIK